MIRTPLKNYAVNWADGMKLTRNHFIKADAHFHDAIRDACSTSLNSFNFGLLPPLEGQQASLTIRSYPHPNSHVEVILESCNIVTSNGTRIVFWEGLFGDDPPRLSVKVEDMEPEDASFYVVINISLFENIPFGSPDPEEIPLRHPFSCPKISLQLMPKRQTNSEYLGGYQFIVGLLNWKDQRFEWENDYIPPSTCISSHQSLVSFLEKINVNLSYIKNHSVTIIRKNNFGNPVNNKLAQNTCNLCDEILEFISNNIFEIKYIIKEYPPIFLVNKFSLLANRINTALLTLEDKQREELLQYYHEWENVRPVEFESILGELMELNYNHADIRGALNSIERFIDMLLLLWKTLSKLEHIGQRKENIVVREEIPPEANTDKKWNLLD